jgi:hypothetical protein
MTQVDFSDRLMTGERIAWTGEPARGLRLGPRDIFLIPFSVLWLGFVVFWISGVLGMGGDSFMALFGAVSFLVGFVTMVGRFFIDAWLRGGTFYCLTNQRLLILRRRPGVSLTAIGPARLSEAHLTERADGSGTIRVGPATPLFGRMNGVGFGVWIPSLDPTPTLIGIPGAREVFDKIQRLAAAPPV